MKKILKSICYTDFSLYIELDLVRHKHDISLKTNSKVLLSILDRYLHILLNSNWAFDTVLYRESAELGTWISRWSLLCQGTQELFPEPTSDGSQPLVIPTPRDRQVPHTYKNRNKLFKGK